MDSKDATTYIPNREESGLKQAMQAGSRPPELPEYGAPPLNEVVLGVQFAPVVGYQQAFVSNVWELFKTDYPNVQEHPPLQPQFETFGRHRSIQLGVELLTSAMHSRYWFLSNAGENLIQFQNDRLLHNWRKVGNESNPYPRFENMIAEYEAELAKLEAFFASLSPEPLNINQVEVTYINHIDYGDKNSVDDWFRILQFNNHPVDDFSMTYRRIMKSESEKPHGRLHVELATAIKAGGKNILAFKLTVRGAPSTQTVSGAIDLIRRGREAIVNEFTSVTTGSAHQRWNRQQ